MYQELNDIEWTHLARYLAGEGSAAEVEHWMSADPGRSALVDQLRHVLEERQVTSLHWNVEEEVWLLKERLKAYRDSTDSWKVASEIAPVAPNPYLGASLSTRDSAVSSVSNGMRVPVLRSVRRNVWYTLAGVAAGIVAVVAGWQMNITHMLPNSARTELGYTTYTTANGERATITLADGNTVALNVASRLEVPTNYGSGNHVVRLPVGEALFTVSHRSGTPFTVVSGPATARVLGTSFVVRHYDTDTTAMIAVNEGKVAVDSVVVTARRLIEVGRQGVFHMEPADASRFTFATGILTFDGVPLSAAIVELNRWYDADIHVDDPSLAARRLKGKFAAGSLADLSSILELTFNIRTVRDGRVLHLYPSR